MDFFLMSFSWHVQGEKHILISVPPKDINHNIGTSILMIYPNLNCYINTVTMGLQYRNN